MAPRLPGLLGALSRPFRSGGGDGWVEPQNDVTRAIYASLDYEEFADNVEELLPIEAPAAAEAWTPGLSGASPAAIEAAAEAPTPPAAEEVPPQKKRRRLRFGRAA